MIRIAIGREWARRLNNWYAVVLCNTDLSVADKGKMKEEEEEEEKEIKQMTDGKKNFARLNISIGKFH